MAVARRRAGQDAAVPRQRLGVALLVPSPVAVELDALRRALGDEDTSRIPPHITLVPPVNVREEDVDDAVGVLTAAAGTVGRLRIELGPVTSFAPVSPTVHLAVGGDVDGVHALRDAVFTPPLSRPLTHEFVPHVTLIEGTSHIDAALTALAGFDASIVIDQVHLMRESRRDDGSRIWRPVADAPLGSRPAVIGRGGLELELQTSGALPPAARRWLDERWTEHQAERFGAPTPPYEPLAVVARREGRIVATAEGDTRATGEAYLAELMVAGDVRGEGIGAHVLAAFASAAAERGATYLTLRTEADGRSRAFYERLGFEEWYRMPAWRNGRDFVQMKRDL
jgi:2'-5' RNA ligase/ribosomal protein S18 acetylase RimI-like enzyme